MKKIIYFFLAILLVASVAKAQTTAMDFTKNDCGGISHHLYSELDAGNVIIMEFIMDCSSCIASGHAIESMMADLEMQYPGKVHLYQIAYTNSYTCATMDGFRNNNNFSSTVFDHGAAEVAYYGGFGMPTVAVAAGTAHDVIFSSVGFSVSDTGMVGQSIRAFFSTLDVKNTPSEISAFSVYPNPAESVVTIELGINQSSNLSLSIMDLKGQLVKEVTNENITGAAKFEVNVSDIPSGIYMAKATINNKSSYVKFQVTR